MLAWEQQVRRLGFSDARPWARERHLSPSILGMLLREMKYLLSDFRKAGLTESQGEDKALNAFLPDSESLPKITAVLCAAHPTNLAKQPTPATAELSLASGESAFISQNSVNGAVSDDTSGNARWWLFQELQAASQGHNFAHHTTRLQEWQIALFGGLYYKAVQGPSTDVCMELDYWLKIRSVSEGTRRALLLLRQDLEEGYAIKALEARSGGRLKASTDLRKATHDVETQLQHAILLLAGIDVDIGEIQDVEVPEESVRPDSTDQDGPQGDDPGSAGHEPEDLQAMLVPELRSLAKKHGLKTAGRKAELIERLSSVQH